MHSFRRVVAACLLAMTALPVVSAAHADDVPAMACSVSGYFRYTPVIIGLTESRGSINYQSSTGSCNGVNLDDPFTSFSVSGSWSCYTGQGDGVISITWPNGSTSSASMTFTSLNGLQGVGMFTSGPGTGHPAALNLSVTRPDPVRCAYGTWVGDSAEGAFAAYGVRPEQADLLLEGCDETGVGLPNEQHLTDNPTAIAPDCRTADTADVTAGQAGAVGTTTAAPVAQAGLDAVQDNVNTRQRVCQSGYRYTAVKRKQPDRFRKAPGDHVVYGFNPTNLTQDITGSRSVSNTWTVEFKASFSVSEGVIFAGVKEEFSISLAHSRTVNKTIGATEHVPAHSRGWVDYGWEDEVYTGQYLYQDSDCYTKVIGNVTVYSPMSEAFKFYTAK